MTVRRIVAAATIGVCLLLLGVWLADRVNTFGIMNVLSRDHCFSDQRPLTEQVAIELTRQALEDDRYDTSVLTLSEHGYERSETFLLRDSENIESGRVYWVQLSPNNENVIRSYNVHIEKRGSEICCRVYRMK